MQAVLLAQVPILSGNVVSESIFVRMKRHLGIARGTGGKEHQHGVAAAGRILGAHEATAEQRILGVEVVPALTLSADKDLCQLHSAGILCQLHLSCGISVGGTKDGADARRLEAIGKIVLNELIGSRNSYCAELVKSQHSEPELIVTLEHQHYPVAPLYAERLEIVCALGGGILHILEGEAALGHIVCHVKHSQLLGLSASYLVHGIKGEVVFLLVAVMYVHERAVFILLCGYKLLAEQRSCSRGMLALSDVHRLVGGITRHDHGKEHTIRAVDSYHTVGGGRLEEYAVTLSQYFLAVTDANTHRALDHHIELLTCVSDGVDGSVLQLLRVLIGYPIRGRQLLSEHRCHVLNSYAVLAGGGESLASAGDRIARQLGTVTLENIGKLKVKGLRTLMYKCEGQVHAARLVGAVYLLRDLGHLRHLRDGIAEYLTHLTDTESDLLQLIHTGLHTHN